MSNDPVAQLITSTAQNTLLGDLIESLQQVVECIRFNDWIDAAINIMDFITLGVGCHLLGRQILRDMVQSLMHQTDALTPAVRRATFSATLHSKIEQRCLRMPSQQLLRLTEQRLPDRLERR